MMNPALRTTTHVSRSSRHGFTLIELLVVMGIIAILTGVMFPAVHTIMVQVKERKTEHVALNLRNAINSYFTEYRRLPYDISAHTGDTILLQSDEQLMNILCGMDTAAGEGGLNPARNVYFSDRTAKTMGEGRYHSGQRIDGDGNAYLYDPWGEFYQVMLDGDNNGRVDKPAWDKDSASHEIASSILVWSMGPDKKAEGDNDNVKAW
ncbi:MAG: type II secretion system protein [Verrucomicrobiales bacterium]|nr:type II secretion system protein [Verrucomicrobiales bacterium]